MRKTQPDPVNRQPTRLLHPADIGLVASTRPPAKLNLFLELLARREDGFHEIDTVMVPIDWRDSLHLRRTEETGIKLSVDWLPSRDTTASRLGVTAGSADADRLLTIPDDETNIVHRALRLFAERFSTSGGFAAQLWKSIPAGAGMGGASSDAASALRCAAKLSGIATSAIELNTLAAEIGSDVPFFLGQTTMGQTIRGQTIRGQTTRAGADKSLRGARARGRGEQIESISLAEPLDVVVVYPNVGLSTAKVYAGCQVPADPVSATPLVEALNSGNRGVFFSEMLNRLAEPARKLTPQIDEILQSMWRTGLPRCQLTGSGSACFAVANSTRQASRCAKRLRSMLQPGHLVVATRTACVPAPIDVR